MASKENNAEWARLVYKNQLEAIEHVKRRQWAATNYILVIFAAVIGSIRLLTAPSGNTLMTANPAVQSIQKLLWGEYLFLYIVAFLVGSLGIYHLFDMHKTMRKYRKRAYKINQIYYFTKQFDPIKKETLSFWYYLPSITLPFIALVLIGFVFVILYLNKFLPGELKKFCLVWQLIIPICFYIPLAVYSCKTETD
jgi:hypothetical protein